MTDLLTITGSPGSFWGWSQDDINKEPLCQLKRRLVGEGGQSRRTMEMYPTWFKVTLLFFTVYKWISSMPHTFTIITNILLKHIVGFLSIFQKKKTYPKPIGGYWVGKRALLWCDLVEIVWALWVRSMVSVLYSYNVYEYMLKSGKDSWCDELREDYSLSINIYVDII